MALIWQRWIDYTNALRLNWSYPDITSQDLNDFVIASFVQWQVSSVLLAMAFMYFTVSFGCW